MCTKAKSLPNNMDKLGLLLAEEDLSWSYTFRFTLVFTCPLGNQLQWQFFKLNLSLNDCPSWSLSNKAIGEWMKLRQLNSPTPSDERSTNCQAEKNLTQTVWKSCGKVDRKFKITERNAPLRWQNSSNMKTVKGVNM